MSDHNKWMIIKSKWINFIEWSFPKWNFSVYRCDCSKNTSQKKNTVGVLIAVKNCFNLEVILSGDSFGCEQLWVKISNSSRTIYVIYTSEPHSIGNVYWTHDFDEKKY